MHYLSRHPLTAGESIDMLGFKRQHDVFSTSESPMTSSYWKQNLVLIIAKDTIGLGLNKVSRYVLFLIVILSIVYVKLTGSTK